MVIETNSIAIGTKELLQRKIYVKKRHFFTIWYFEKFINRMNGGYKMIWKLSHGNKEHVQNENVIVLKISPDRWPFSVSVKTLKYLVYSSCTLCNEKGNTSEKTSLYLNLSVILTKDTFSTHFCLGTCN